MLKSEIEIGETYLFVGSTSPKRRHLAGLPFTVVKKERVFRRLSFRKSKTGGITKVLRFFNDDGIGARAEELEPLEVEEAAEQPADLDTRVDPCTRCDTGDMLQDGFSEANGDTNYKCNVCGHRVTCTTSF